MSIANRIDDRFQIFINSLQEVRLFYDNQETTLEDVGKMYGITRERIRQIESKAMRKIVVYLYQRRFISKEQYESVVDEKDKKKLKPKTKKHRYNKP